MAVFPFIYLLTFDDVILFRSLIYDNYINYAVGSYRTAFMYVGGNIQLFFKFHWIRFSCVSLMTQVFLSWG